MLGADRVHARRRGTELKLVRLDERARARALEVAGALLSTAAALSGAARDEVEGAIKDVSASFDNGPADRRVIDGLWKLLDDAIVWDSASTALDPVEIRRAVFQLASARRGAGAFDRDAVLSEIAAAHGAEPAAIERALYADLRQAQRLIEAPPWSAETLVSAWENAQAQAVLLRAVRIEVWVSCGSAGAYRALFHRLKFLRLLHEVHPAGKWPNGAREGGHRIVIDGPFSMFESVTKYGLKLAMIVPVLESADAFHLVAEVRWGHERRPLTFRLDGGAAKGAEPPPLSDDVQALLDRFRAAESEWSVSPSPDVLELPAIGLCVPDLVFEHRDGTRVFLEVLGFWSREAVFRRIELVEAGLPQKILFAVSKRLRVREELLEEGLPGALYVFKGTMSARAILERLEALRRRS